MNDINLAERFSASWLHQALEAGGMGTWFWDIETNNLFFDETQQELTQMVTTDGVVKADEFFDRIHRDDVLRVREEVEQAMTTKQAFRSEFRLMRDDDTVIWLGARGDLVALDGNSYSHFAGVNWDISRLKEAEFQADMTAKEMAHRVKNLLGLVAGIARMTAKNSESIKEFLSSFNKRLSAIAGVNQLILGTDTHRDSLKNLVRDTLHSVSGSNQITVSVDDFELNSRGAQTLVLVLNELATNAVKYGALTSPNGKVDLSILVDRATERFTLRWAENKHDAIVQPSEKKGFGTQVLSSLTRATFNGEPSYQWKENGLVYECVWSAPQMSIENQSPPS